ncbi:MAG TPA: nitrogen fixation protein NifH, partial [Clostridia bacterium]|nr:nitrogen fixation protein NifH [Clostridia bacterium]
MDAWKTLLRADPTEWLLEEENPSVRYFALRDLFDKPEDDPEVIEAKSEIMEKGAVPEILTKQREAEYLAAYPRFYTNKYRGLVWSLIALAELGAEPVPQIREQCEYLLKHAQEALQGGFSQATSAKTGGGMASEVIPCLTGNMVWSLIRFGYVDDPRLWKGVDWLTAYMRLNDGVETEPQIPP